MPPTISTAWKWLHKSSILERWDINKYCVQWSNHYSVGTTCRFPILVLKTINKFWKLFNANFFRCCRTSVQRRRAFTVQELIKCFDLPGNKVCINFRTTTFDLMQGFIWSFRPAIPWIQNSTFIVIPFTIIDIRMSDLHRNGVGFVQLFQLIYYFLLSFCQTQEPIISNLHPL